MNRFKKVLAMLLSIMMVMGSMPVEALAEQFVVETQDVGQPAAVAQPTYTITFNSNHGQGQVPSQKVGKRMILPSGEGLSRENHTFMGWGLDPNSGLSENNSIRPFYLAGHEVSIRKDTTFYAVWATAKEATYFIRLDGIIPQEPCNPPKANYTSGISGRVKYNTFYANTSGVNGHLETIPTTKEIRELCNQNVGNISFANGEGKYEFCASDGEFEDLYHVVWYVVKLEQDGYHVDGVLLKNNMYTLRYDPNCDVYQGEVPPGQQYKAGTNVQITNNIITRNGYTFVGWNTKADGSGTPYSGDGSNGNSSLIMPPRDVILYAQWDPNYLIKYKYTGDVPPKGSVSEPPARRSDVDEGTEIEIPAMPIIYDEQVNEAYSHDEHWKVDMSLEYTDDTHYKMPARNITWTLNWVYHPRYTVNYYKDAIADGKKLGTDTGRGDIGENIPYENGKYAPEGYWKNGTTDGPKVITRNENENVLNVVYTRDIPYQVEFYYENANDDLFTIDNQKTETRTGLLNQSVSVTQKDKEKTENGKFVYDANNENKIESVMLDSVTDIKVLRLYFKRKTYSVTYEYIGEVPARAPQAPTDSSSPYKHGETVNVQQVTPIPAGYTFSGWSPTSESNLTEPIGGSFAMPANNVVLKGSWSAKNDTRYIVEHYLQKLDGSYVKKDTEDKTGTTGDTASYPEKTYTGFSFESSKTEFWSSNNKLTETGKDTILGDGSLVIKLYYKRNKVDINVTKTWKDDNNRDGIRPDKNTFTVTLKATVDGVEKTYSVPASGAGSWSGNNVWTGTIGGVPTHDLKGNEIVYQVVETNPIPGYVASNANTESIKPAVGQQSVLLENEHSIDTIDISGQKTWIDGNGTSQKRPTSIIIKLMKGTSEMDRQTVRPDDHGVWSWNFTGKPKNENGKRIVYSVEEEPVAGYNSTTYSDSYNVTNTIDDIGDTITVSGTKTWVDGETQHDNAKDVVLTLTQKSTKANAVGTTISNDKLSWNGNVYTYADLPKYDREGYLYTYTVTETQVAGYAAPVYSGTNDYDITNTKLQDITVTKNWDEPNGSTMTHPLVSFMLYKASDTVRNTPIATAVQVGNTDQYKFTYVPYEPGGYVIVEVMTGNNVNYYTTNSETHLSADETSVGVTNTRRTDGQLTISKNMVDNSSDSAASACLYFGFRVTRNNQQVGNIVYVQGGKSEIVSDLHLGETYTVTETGVYTKNGTAYEEVQGGLSAWTTSNSPTSVDLTLAVPHKTVTVTNTRKLYHHNGELIVAKSWKDTKGNNLMAPLPSSLTVGLFANAATTPVQTIDLSGNTWTGTFKNLPATDVNGNQITYTVKELGQDGSYVGAGETIMLQANGKSYEYTCGSQVTDSTVTLTNTLKDTTAKKPVKTGAPNGVARRIRSLHHHGNKQPGICRECGHQGYVGQGALV